MPPLLLHTPRLLLRTPSPADALPWAAILQEPDLARFWPGFDRARIERELVQAADVTVLTITEPEPPGAVLGAIQYDEHPDAEYRHAGIDLFLGTRWQGHGLASEALRAVLEHLISARGHHRF